MKCLQNVKPGQLSISAPEIKAFNQRRRKLAVVKYLVENCHEQSERRAVIDSVAINLKHLDNVLSAEDVTSSVNGATPAAQRYVPVQPPQVNIAPPINPFAQPIRRHPPIFPNPPFRHARKCHRDHQMIIIVLSFKINSIAIAHNYVFCVKILYFV